MVLLQETMELDDTLVSELNCALVGWKFLAIDSIGLPRGS